MLASLLPAVIGAVLVWAGGFKLLGTTAATAARRSALPALVGDDRAVPAFRLVGTVELGIGALLLLPPAAPAEAVLAAGLCAGFVGYLGYARTVVPESSCGCTSARHTPIRVRAFARAGVLAVAAGYAATGDRWWGDALAARPGAGVTVLVGAALVVLALSDDLDRHWLLPLRRLRVRLSHPLGRTAGSFTVPVESSVHQLLRSPAYAAAGTWVRSDLLDSWDEGEWRMLHYAARIGDRPATAVFAVPRDRYDPPAVRAALVDEHTRTILWEHAPVPA